jgi:hypothetical protein
MIDRTDLAEAIRRVVRAVVPPRRVDNQVLIRVEAVERFPTGLVRSAERSGFECGLSPRVVPIMVARALPRPMS